MRGCRVAWHRRQVCVLVSGGVCDGSQRQDQVLGDEHTDRRSVGAPDSRTDDEAYGRAIDASDGCADSDADNGTDTHADGLADCVTDESTNALADQ